MKNELLHNLGKPMKPGRFADQMNTPHGEVVVDMNNYKTLFQLEKGNETITFIINRTTGYVKIRREDDSYENMLAMKEAREDWNLYVSAGWKRVK